jgi:predicted dehydrogenase
VPFWPTPAALLDRCDAVGICSPTALHPALIEQAAAAGCHVLCEKPLATTLADCDRIAAAVAAAGVTFMQSFPKRFEPVNHELKRMLAAGELGRLSMARVRHGHAYGLDPAFQKAWFVDPTLAGGGALLDEGVHGADLIRWLFGEPESVMAMTANATFGAPLEDAAIAVFRFASGLLVELAPSWCYPAADNSIELYGTGGTAILSGVDLASRDLTESGFLKTYRVGQPARRWQVSPLVPRSKSGTHHQQVAQQFLATLRAGTPPPITLEDGRRALTLILAAYEAASTGRTVPVPPA